MSRAPVLLLVFNRPAETARVFEAIREARPSRLYVGADGPRAERPNEERLCEEARACATAVDWDCEVHTLFRYRNLGCKRAVEGAIDWFFEREPEGVILEDDCLPSRAFFPFMDELLERYRDDERIFLVTGYNRMGTWKPERHDYFFSLFGGIWGWGSWRRAWRHYDGEMAALETFTERGHFEHLLGRRQGQRRAKELRASKAGAASSWAYPWAFARHTQGGLACVPSRSLIQNIGFGDGATHTTGEDPFGVTAREHDGPWRENPFVVPDRDYDWSFFPAPSLTARLAYRLGALLRGLGRDQGNG